MRRVLAADYDHIHLLPPSVEDWWDRGVRRGSSASVVRANYRGLLSEARARWTLARMSEALAVQMKGLAERLCSAR